jgi:hypothetical protein
MIIHCAFIVTYIFVKWLQMFLLHIAVISRDVSTSALFYQVMLILRLIVLAVKYSDATNASYPLRSMILGRE